MNSRIPVAGSENLSVFVCLVLSVFLLLSLEACQPETERSVDPELESSLAERFMNPPDDCKPWVNWLWVNGNVTREGILADLKAMQRVGIGGFLMMSTGPYPHMPTCVEHGPVEFMSEEYKELFEYTLNVAGELGLEVAMSVCDGFTNAGGPLITPETGMHQLTWSEIPVEGPAVYTGRLEQPPTNLDYYRDIAVLAYPGPAAETESPILQISGIQSNASDEDLSILLDGNLNTFVNFEKPTGEPVYVELEFPDTFSCRAVSIAMPEYNLHTRQNRRANRVELQISDDGDTFRTVATWNLFWRRRHHPELFSLYETTSITVRLDEVRSSHYRVVLHGRNNMVAGEINLIASERLHFWEAKAGFADLWGYGGGADNYDLLELQSPNSPGSDNLVPHLDPIKGRHTIIKEQILDLTAHFEEDGTLNWEVPPGNWNLVRIGYTPTGQGVISGTVEGRGLECNKLDAAGIEKQFQHVILPLLEETEHIQNSPFHYAHIDSWESACQSWTPRMREEFIRRRGYDPIGYYPVLSGGRVVNSIEESERFLWDYRRTIADLISDNFYGRYNELCHENGLRSHAQPSGAQQFLSDPIAFHSRVDVSMGEFWIPANRPRLDCKYSSSAAHIYGSDVVRGEAFTGSHPRGTWQEDPGWLKRFGDAALCMGINHFEIQCFAHQPWLDREPGMACHRWGIYYDRTNTWFEQSRAWLEYLSRCQYLLRQGIFVADIVCMTSEGVPAKVGYREDFNPSIPVGYDYDACNADVVINLMYVEDGLIKVPGGMNYKILLLPDRSSITPALLNKIKKLVRDGAVVVGPKPSRAPGLNGYPGSDTRVEEIAEEIWVDCDGINVKENQYGKGRVIWGKSFEEIFSDLEINPDFEYKGQDMGALAYIHRRTAESEIYFVSNLSEKKINTEGLFRVEGKVPQLWDPINGGINTIESYEVKADGRILLPLQLEKYESVFVMFRDQSCIQPDQTNPRTLPFEKDVNITGIIDLTGDWNVAFPVSEEKVVSVVMDDLYSWTLSEDPELKYFSGTATYSRKFELTNEYTDPNLNLVLDLGEMSNLAEIRLNGQDLGILWSPPYKCDISNYIRSGENHLEIRITNLWPNRLIGDMNLPEERRTTFATTHPYTKDSPLSPSGLFGPVRIESF